MSAMTANSAHAPGAFSLWVWKQNAAEALRRGRPLKVRDKVALLWYLDNGWKILSHTPAGQPYATQSWLLILE